MVKYNNDCESIRLYDVTENKYITTTVAWGEYRYYKSFHIGYLELIYEISKSITRYKIFISTYGKDISEEEFCIKHFSIWFPKNKIKFKDCRRLFKIKLRKKIDKKYHDEWGL